jgi:hypothetical protein
MPGCALSVFRRDLTIRWSPIPPSTGERNNVGLRNTQGRRRSRYKLSAPRLSSSLHSPAVPHIASAAVAEARAPARA